MWIIGMSQRSTAMSFSRITRLAQDRFLFCEVGIALLSITYIDIITALLVFYCHRVSTQLQFTNISINSWRMKDQLHITCYFISLIMCSTCFGHYYIHHQELATVLMNYHIGRLVLSSLCVVAFVAAGFRWCSLCRLKPALFGTWQYLGSADFFGVRQVVNCDVNLTSVAHHCSVYRLLTDVVYSHISLP